MNATLTSSKRQRVGPAFRAHLLALHACMKCLADARRCIKWSLVRTPGTAQQGAATAVTETQSGRNVFPCFIATFTAGSWLKVRVEFGIAHSAHEVELNRFAGAFRRLFPCAQLDQLTDESPQFAHRMVDRARYKHLTPSRASYRDRKTASAVPLAAAARPA